MIRKIAIASALAITFAGCSLKPASRQNSAAPGTETVTRAANNKSSIEIKGFAFSPATLTVKAGEKITVTNRDIPSHTMTADDGKSFDTPVLGQGQSATITAPEKPGTYSFHCTPHPNMKGTLIVE